MSTFTLTSVFHLFYQLFSITNITLQLVASQLFNCFACFSSIEMNCAFVGGCNVRVTTLSIMYIGLNHRKIETLDSGD